MSTSLKDTLTGSQKNRTYKELSLYPNPLFVACFELGEWHFSHPKISKIAGEAFWSKIDIDYNLLVTHLRKMVHQIEKEFLNFSIKYFGQNYS
ncbi:MAG: hypothetical protein KME32_11495 [Mojavia pulchra JT2-VF2]|jgi:hypothetical protein|uniref:Uncharacterized protein n=1 Tax=Mojavia pulchra JT2-VF2 TaxID=287848 RepID=A0A951PWS6_9NOST|nr:hypothetical protein [Mojavia pulchra JT2-VF2]